jgi:hypothetical protein
MGSFSVTTINSYDYPPKYGLIAKRRDHDCVENRLLDYLTEYLNKIDFSKNKKVFYGQATSFKFLETTKPKGSYFAVNLRKYFKDGDFVSNRNCQMSISLEMGELFLRSHKIKELVNKIKRSRINKR